MKSLILTFLLPAAFAGAADALHTFKRVDLAYQYFSEGATLGDMNRDGKADVISGPYWYEGPDFQKKHEIYPVKVADKNGYSMNCFFTWVADFDGDGWNDLLYVGFPGTAAVVFTNPKGREEHWKSHPVFNKVDNESPSFLDVTGDGKPEIICMSDGFIGYATPDWSDASKPWTFHRISDKGPWVQFTHGLGIGDVNGDGRMDFLEKDAWWEQPASLSGDPVWKKHPAAFGSGGSQMFAYDVDGDGDNDVICSLAAHGYGIAWFEQFRDGGEITFREHRITGSTPAENPYGVCFSQPHALNLLDIDGDGVKDILTGKCFWAHGDHGDPEPNSPAVLYWFRLSRNGGAVEFIPHLIDDNSGVGRQINAGALNSDGLPDIVVGNKKGTIIFLHEKRKVSRKEWLRNQPVRVSTARAEK